MRLNGMSQTLRHNHGHKAELYACAFLRRQAHQIVARNYQYSGGELDIVTRNPMGMWIFVEVKSVWHPRMGNPNRRVGYRKQDRIWRTAVHFLHHHGGLDQASRFDVIAVDCRSGKPSIEHYPGAFEGRHALGYC